MEYRPHKIISFAKHCLDVSSNTALAEKLLIDSSTVSDISSGKRCLSGKLLLIIHELTGESVKSLRLMMGDDRATPYKNPVKVNGKFQFKEE